MAAIKRYHKTTDTLYSNRRS